MYVHNVGTHHDVYIYIYNLASSWVCMHIKLKKETNNMYSNSDVVNTQYYWNNRYNIISLLLLLKMWLISLSEVFVCVSPTNNNEVSAMFNY